MYLEGKCKSNREWLFILTPKVSSSYAIPGIKATTVYFPPTWKQNKFSTDSIPWLIYGIINRIQWSQTAHSLQLEITSHLIALVYTSTYCPTKNNPRIEYKYHAITGQFDISYCKNYLFHRSAMRATLLYLLRFSCLVRDTHYIKQLENK